MNPAAAISKHLPLEPGLANVLGLTCVFFRLGVYRLRVHGPVLTRCSDPHHQSPAPAGSTDLLIGPRQTLAPLVQPDRQLIGRTVAP